MNYQQLRDFALQCSLEHHLCNVDELLPTKTPDEVLEIVGEADDSVIIYEPYEYLPTDDLVESIEDLRGVYVVNFMHVLNQVNGAEWVINFKAGV